MRIPKDPPKFEELMKEVSQANRILEVIDLSSSWAGYEKYLHWDKARYYPPPEGFTAREAWLATKFKRRGLAKEVPLYDRFGNPFHYVPADPMAERLHEIDLGAGGRIQMPGQLVNTDTRDRYYVNSLIEEAITSSQLEGATTTRKVASEMIRQGREPRDKSERMILNNYVTMKRIGELTNCDLTKELVFEIHRLVTDRTLEDQSAAGRFRTATEQIRVEGNYGEVYHEPPPASSLEDRMKEMCDFANGVTPEGFLHPVIRSIILHFWLSYDHPFVDGNGRTARALFYWSMRRHRYWLAEFISISHIIRKAPVKYGRAFLHTEHDDNDLTYFIRYHLHVIRRALTELHDYIARKTKELEAIESELRGMVVLNHRQRALIGHALRHPNQRYLVESHRLSHNVSYETARSDLLNLEKRQLLRSVKAGKQNVYFPVGNLHSALKGLAD